MADFLNRLRARSSTFVGGTYPHHDWGENSVDVFLNVGEDDQGFYKVGPTETFLDAVNDTANEDGPYGKCAWRAVYNDDRIIAKIEAKYGARRITKAPHHGPSPDKLLHFLVFCSLAALHIFGGLFGLLLSRNPHAILCSR